MNNIPNIPPGFNHTTDLASVITLPSGRQVTLIVGAPLNRAGSELCPIKFLIHGHEEEND